MSSIIHGFEYDIFISYRHNDNLDGWVTDFVQNLEKELKGTLKESVTIYFDKDPKDGLLETHNVDKSLEGKLRCLIFIPILSQTYCDPKGFAWEHEFVAFNKIATASEFGRDVKLDGGNVACRILPARIHDLDPDDKATVEREMGSALRSIDFTYKEPGVNRPLTPDDNADVNQNKTRYKNQVNKVANAIKDLLHGLRHVGERRGPSPSPDRTSATSAENQKSSRLVYAAAAVVVALALGYWVFNNFVGTASPEEGLEKSIAVLPFTNLSKDPEQEYFSDGITDQIITNLSHLSDVKVIARTSVLKYKGTTASISDIGADLNVNYVLEGSVQKSGNQLRINAQLIRTNDNSHAWAEIFDRNLTDIFAVQDDISQSIAQALGNTLVSEELDKDRPSNTEAYDTYLRAKHIAFTQYYWNRRENIAEAFNNAKSLYEKAIQLDPDFALAYAGLADLYDELGNHNRAAFPKELDMLRISLVRKAFKLDPNSGFVNNVKAFSFLNGDSVNYDSGHYYLKRAHILDPGDSYLTWCLGQFYAARGLQEEALPYLLQALDENPNDPKAIVVLGQVLYNLGRTEEAKAQFEKAIRIGDDSYFGNDLTIIWLLSEHQVDRAAKMMQADTYQNAPMKSLLAAAEGRKEAITPDLLRPINYLLLGMPAEALDMLDKSKSKTWNPYTYMQNNPLWAPTHNLPDYPRVLEKARIANIAVKRRYGFQ